MKRTILLSISALLTGVSISQTQIGNAGFETWENVSSGQEPTNWNSFKTAQGGFASFSAVQIVSSTDVRPGTTGTKSAKINARNVPVFNITANGNVTLGIINMGSSDAASTSNYNTSKITDANFSEALTQRPDSIVFWAKFISGNGSTTDQARMKASLHSNYAYRDPEDAASTAQVVASAVVNYNATAGWVRYSVPFVYTANPVTPAFLLVTFTTNKNPGGGNPSDVVYIDDVELKYNQAPVAVNDSYSGDENTVISCPVLTNDTDPENNLNNTSVSIITQPLHGSVVVGATGIIAYTPNTNYYGSDSYVYKVCDNGNQIECSNNATVSITVNQVNQQIVANADAYFTPVDVPVACDVLTNDTDVENEINISSIEILANPTNGILNVNTTTGVVTYTPNLGYIGDDSFTYKICDAGNPTPITCANAVVSITVYDAAVNQQVIANDDSFSGLQDNNITCTVLANDVDPENSIDITSLVVIVNPLHGSTAVSNGTIIYTPTAGYYGPDSFEYKVCDNGVPTTCDTGLVNITVTGNVSINELTIADVEIKMVGNTIYFQGLEDNSGTYYVYDLVGQLIQKGRISTQVPFNQKSGVYLITVDSNIGMKTKRVYKN